MKPIKVLELSEVDRLKLEKGYHNGPTHSFRIRCKSILLKSEGKSAPKIAEMLEVTVPTVYAWIKRYEENGIKGLKTRPGQGRKPIMDCSDEEAVRKAIEEDRQSVSKAREAWQNATGKEASDITFKIYNHFSTILNVVPFPSSDSFTKIFPLWYSSTIRFTSDRPSPQPRSLVVNPG